MSTITDLAQSVVAELNAGSWSQEFRAETAFMPLFELGELRDLKVTVVPRSLALERVGRGQAGRVVEIDIGVQKKIADDSEIEPLLSLVERIIIYFDAKRLANMSSAICTKVINEPIYSPEHLQQYRQFLSVLTLTFKVTG